MKERFAVFTDFDGTITSGDVGYEMFRKFTGGRTEPTVERYRRGEINSLQCLTMECEIWNSNPPDPGKVRQYLDSRKIENGFFDFLYFLENEKIDLTILSEGFDFYIDMILGSHRLNHLNRITNKAVYSGGLIRPEFPYFEAGCGQCSNCKGYHVSNGRSARGTSFFIGDGHSDIHGCKEADIVFARGFLARYLEEKLRFHFRFNDFSDILNVMSGLIKKNIFLVTERINICIQSERHRPQIRQMWESGEVMKHVGFPRGLGLNDEKYSEHWSRISNDRDNLYLALEDKDGNFMGEAKLSAPDDSGICSHDLKLVPDRWGKGFAKEAWTEMLRATNRRWPEAAAEVTPSVENTRAIKLYRSLGFEPCGREEFWEPPETNPNAVPVRYIRMIKRRN